MNASSTSRTSRVVVLVTILGVGWTGGCGGKDPEPAPVAPVAPTNVRPKTPRSLVVVDLSGVRYDEVVPAAGTVPAVSKLPGFRALERQGAFFTQAVASAGWDAPSIAGLFSGLSPEQCTVQGSVHDGPRTMIPAIETLAEMLKDGGYATGAFTAGGRVHRHSGLQQGFTTWEETPDDAVRLEKASRWMRALANDAPRFLFFHALATPEGASNDATKRAARLQELDTLHQSLRALADATRGKDDAWFVVLSDHGDVLSNDREGGLDAGDTGTLDAQIRVPLVVVGPGFKSGAFDASVSLLDVVPTIRDLLGLDRKTLIEGRAWTPILGAPTSPGRPALSMAWRRAKTSTNPMRQRVVSVRTRETKFTAEFDLGNGNWTESIFDLRSDPGEANALPAGDVTRFGDDFARAVELVRKSFREGKALRNDDVAGGYFIREAGK